MNQTQAIDPLTLERVRNRIALLDQYLAQLGAPAPQHASLLRVHKGKTALLPLGADQEFGRCEEGLPEHDPGLSARHFRIWAHEDGHVCEDLGSRNGTLVNNTRITRYELVPGDLIQAGNTLFFYLNDLDLNPLE